MAAGRISAPGTKLGPCPTTKARFVELTCGHIDCAETRAIAASVCRYCGVAIGYLSENGRDGQFFETGDGGFVHASCEEDAAEEQRAQIERANPCTHDGPCDPNVCA